MSEAQRWYAREFWSTNEGKRSGKDWTGFLSVKEAAKKGTEKSDSSDNSTEESSVVAESVFDTKGRILYVESETSEWT